MTTSRPTFAPAYFDRLYAKDPDPWKFATSEYERKKYAETLAALPPYRLGAAFEVGCSIGILTRQLAHHCDSLLSVDVAEAPLQQARKNCAGIDHVTFRRMQVPNEWPSGSFDLILLSEVLYFLDADDIARTASKVVTSLRTGGLVLLVNWVKGTDYPCSGDDAATHFIAATGDNLTPLRQYREPEYRLDLLVKPD